MINTASKLALGIIVFIIFLFGIYPLCMLNETAGVAESIFKKFELFQQNLPKQ